MVYLAVYQVYQKAFGSRCRYSASIRCSLLMNLFRLCPNRR